MEQAKGDTAWSGLGGDQHPNSRALRITLLQQFESVLHNLDFSLCRLNQIGADVLRKNGGAINLNRLLRFPKCQISLNHE